MPLKNEAQCGWIKAGFMLYCLLLLDVEYSSPLLHPNMHTISKWSQHAYYFQLSRSEERTLLLWWLISNLLFAAIGSIVPNFHMLEILLFFFLSPRSELNVLFIVRCHPKNLCFLTSFQQLAEILDPDPIPCFNIKWFTSVWIFENHFSGSKHGCFGFGILNVFKAIHYLNGMSIVMEVRLIKRSMGSDRVCKPFSSD